MKTDIITISASEFSKNFGRYRELAQQQVVAVTSHERVTGYFLSASAYEDYRRLQAMATQSFAVEELSEATIQAIAKSKMDNRHDHLNALLDD